MHIGQSQYDLITTWVLSDLFWHTLSLRMCFTCIFEFFKRCASKKGNIIRAVNSWTLETWEIPFYKIIKYREWIVKMSIHTIIGICRSHSKRNSSSCICLREKIILHKIPNFCFWNLFAILYFTYPTEIYLWSISRLCIFQNLFLRPLIINIQNQI